MEYETKYNGITSGKKIHVYRGPTPPFVPPLGSYIHIDIGGILEGKIAHINTNISFRKTVVEIFVEEDEEVSTNGVVVQFEKRNGTEG